MLRSTAATFLVLAVSSLAVQSAGSSHSATQQPKLAVVIVVDQMRPDYLSRFDRFYTGGFRRLLDSGAVFLNAFHDHAATETAVGHSTISTGCLPSRHGIIGNDYYDRIEKKNVYAVLDTLSPLVGEISGKGVSPRRMLAPTLGEYLKQMSPESRNFSMAIKDRSAICMAGKQADGVYWFDRRTGSYVTSTYYDSSYPLWVDSFNTAKQVDTYFSRSWEKLLADSVYVLSREDASPFENDGIYTTFPHTFTEFSKHPDKRYYDELYATPFADEVTFSLAKAAVHYEKLGSDSVPDLLWISGSAADAAGHTYGPFSQEMQDFYLRLDLYLGDLFGFLDSVVGANKYVVALSSDHGALPIPEELKQQGVNSGRIHPDAIKADMLHIGDSLVADLLAKHNPFLTTGSEIVLDSTAKSFTDMSVPEFQGLVASRLKQLPYVAATYTRFQLSRDIPQEVDPYWRRYRNCYHPDRGSDLFVRFKENYIVTRDTTGTTHGSAYDYDCIVPIVFFGPGVRSGQFYDRIRTIDIAPTLARLLLIPTDGKFDGSAVKAALRQ
ncbi:MAG: alkaline phosphatase family protein [candidate division Zixibacteria bacterium]|nr:alkaline phosphatase family protein [candidate division Zixibacteria bacterium]